MSEKDLIDTLERIAKALEYIGWELEQQRKDRRRVPPNMGPR